MAKDVSNKTIVILLILLLIVSLAGFWIVSQKIDDIRLYPMPLSEGEEGMDSEASGTISLEIGEAEEHTSVNEATGMISLTILE